jgi:tight adherence protein B
MALVAAIFVAVFAIVLGTYWLLIVRPQSKGHTQLKERLRASAQKATKRLGLMKEVERFSTVGPLNSVLNRTKGVSNPLQALLTQAGLKMNVGTFVLASGCLALAVGLLIMWATRLTWLALGCGVFALFVPYFIVRFMATKRLETFEEQFPDAIELISRSLRAGHAFPTGLAMVAEESPQPVGGEFRQVYDQQSFGMPMTEALRGLAERVPLLDARFFVVAVLTQREAGGNLAEILDNLAKVMRDRFRVKRQIRVITAHGRITGWVLSALPPSLALAFMVTAPSHVQMLINDPLGVYMILVALGLQITGTLIIRRLVKIAY